MSSKYSSTELLLKAVEVVNCLRLLALELPTALPPAEGHRCLVWPMHPQFPHFRVEVVVDEVDAPLLERPLPREDPLVEEPLPLELLLGKSSPPEGD